MSCLQLQSVLQRGDEDTKSEYYNQNFYVHKSIQFPGPSYFPKTTNPNSLKHQERAQTGQCIQWPPFALMHFKLCYRKHHWNTNQTRFVRGLWESEEQLMGSCYRKPAQQNGQNTFVMCHLSGEVPAACPGVGISRRSVGNVSNDVHYIRCACNTPISFSTKIKTVPSKELNCLMETSTALLLPRSDFAKQGLRCSSVSQQEGLQAHEASLARSSTWEHLHNPCTDPAAPVPVPTDHSIPGSPDGMQKELSSQHSIAQPELTHSNPTLHLSTQLAGMKGGAKDFTCAGMGWVSRLKMLFSIEDDSATHYTHTEHVQLQNAF